MYEYRYARFPVFLFTNFVFYCKMKKMIKEGMGLRVAVIGSRQCGDLNVDTVIENIPEDCTAIISGGAMGVDSLARQAAERLGLPFTEYLPDYATFGKLAPIVRNSTIVENSDMLLAFWDYRSRGTRDALLKGMEQRKKIKIILLEENKTED